MPRVAIADATHVVLDIQDKQVLALLAEWRIFLLQVFHVVAFSWALFRIAHLLSVPSQAHLLPIHL